MTDHLAPAAVSERTLPHNLEAERGVLGAVLLDGQRFHEAAEILTGAEFYRDAHRRIWDAMAAVLAADRAVDWLTVRDELTRRGDIDAVGGPAYVSQLVDGVPRASNVQHYARIIRNYHVLREVIFTSNRMLSDAYDAEMDSDVLVERGVEAMLKFATQGSAAPESIGKIAMAFVQALDLPVAQGVVPTGFRDLDEQLSGGLLQQELTIIAARPSVGKTAFSLQVAMACSAKGLPSVFFPIETGRASLGSRAVSTTARVDSSRMRTRFLGEKDYARMAQSLDELINLPLMVQDSAGTLAQVVSCCHRLKQRPEGLALVVVDYLQLLAADGTSLQETLPALTRGLKRMAKELDVAVVALSQLSRQPETRNDKRPHLSDLRDSGCLEQDADTALLLFRGEMYGMEDQRGIAEVIVAKQRNGPTGLVRLAFIKELTRFEDLAAGN